MLRCLGFTPGHMLRLLTRYLHAECNQVAAYASVVRSNLNDVLIWIRSEHVAAYYQWFLDVEIMVFLGFGCLMTFLRRYSYSAIAFNFFISCFVMLYSILILGVFSQVSQTLLCVQAALQFWTPCCNQRYGKMGLYFREQFIHISLCFQI